MSRHSLHNRLLKLTSAAALVIVVLQLAWHITDDISSSREQAHTLAAGMAASTVPLLQSALVVSDLDTAQQTLDAIMSQGQFRSMRLLDHNDHSILIEGRPPAQTRIRQAPTWFQAMINLSFQPHQYRITVGGTTYALLVAEPSPAAVSAIIWHNTMVALGMWTVSLIVLLALLSTLIRSGLRPLDSLAEAARKLGDGDLSARAPRTELRELSETAQAFNYMASRLLEARDHLETLVEKRTAQLSQANQQLEESEARFRIQFEHAPEAILVLDADSGRILDTNSNAERLYGRTRAALLEATLLSLSPLTQPDGQASSTGAMSRIRDTLETEERVVEWTFENNDGQPLACEVRLVRLPSSSGNPVRASILDISERKQAEERIYQLAHHDTLTGLLNRYSLEDRLAQVLLTARRQQECPAIMFIDLDRFKTINDTLGHHIGDLLLIEVARRLLGCVRDSDIVARLGGDEFVVVLSDIPSGMEASPVAEKIRQALAQPYVIEGHPLHSTPSIGISVFPLDGEDSKVLMKNADTAMYHAKDCGRNNVQYFTPAMNIAAMERMELEIELRSALANGEFELHYQHQVEANTGRVAGVEALVRWRHPMRGLVPPMKFIPIAEDVGFIVELGSWVLDQACAQLAAWRGQGIDGIHMAVNISAHQLRSKQLVEQVREALHKHGLERGDLALEITESAAMADPEHARGQLQALGDLGVNLAIDDFGTGYSSLAYLKLLPIHTLKLDQTFVRDIETDESDAAICAATLALAHSLGLNVVAEGVETESQRDYLIAHRCDFLQGYLFGKPSPAASLSQFLSGKETQRTQLAG